MTNPERTYSRSQLEQLLPDYLFGRLSPEEAAAVEEALHAYPDLVAEAEQLRAVFSRLDAMPYMQELERRSSVLSVLVLNRWREHSSGSLRSRYPRPVLMLLPLLGMALVVWWFLARTPSSPAPEADFPASPPVLTVEPVVLPYSEGLMTFTYWTSGMPPSVAASLPSAVPASLADEDLQGLLEEVAAEGVQSGNVPGTAP